ncbi:MAG: DUF4347 domain-containing protein, partial [Novosphingobium sp.]|nr:DUF4347 domain-containing protein [Novosphingobium sp.]
MMFDGAAVATGAEVISAAAAQMTGATYFALPDGIDGVLAFQDGQRSDFAIAGWQTASELVATEVRAPLRPSLLPAESNRADRPWLPFREDFAEAFQSRRTIENGPALSENGDATGSNLVSQEAAQEFDLTTVAYQGDDVLGGSGNTFIFIDSSVGGYEALAAEWADQGTVVIIDQTQDGMEQVLAALAGQTEIEAIHFVSHGASNTFMLGTTWFVTETVTGELSESLALIGSKMAADGDILIYGCDVSDGSEGQHFVDAIALATGADVAASEDGTGHVILGGDWDLENRVGTIEATSLISEDYAGLLQLTNSAGWTLVGGQTYRAIVNGVTVTMEFVDGGGDFNTFVPSTPFRFTSSLETVNGATLGLGVIWNNSAIAGQVIVTFSEAVTDPILNVGGLGGTSGTTNTSVWTVTGGLTLTEMRGEAQFDTTATTFQRRAGETVTGNPHQSGAVRVNGTVTSVTFNVTRAGAQGVGDGLELGWTLERVRPAVALTGTNLLTNGSFENGTTGWSGNSGVQVRDDFGAAGVPAPPDGTFFAEIEGGTSVDPSYLEQSFATVPGQQYTVYLNATTRDSVNTGDRFAISIDGIQREQFTTNDEWRTYGVTFTATGTTTTLRLTSLGSLGGTNAAPNDAFGSVIDDVRVVATDTRQTFTEGDPPLSIVQGGALAFDGDATARLNSTTVTLTNPGAGDRLTVNGSTAASGVLASGITWTNTGTQVVFSGVASEAAYTAAVQTVQFGNATDTPVAGVRDIQVITNDSGQNSTTAHAYITVVPVNDPPVASPAAAQATVDAQVYSYNAGALFADADGDVLTYSATGLPAGLTINPVTGVISGTIDKSASQVNGGVYSIVVTANDGNGGVTQTTIPMTVTNPAPTAVNDAAATLEDTPVDIAVLTNDVDPDGDALTVTSANAGNGSVVINPDGTLTYNPGANFFGTDTITYTISDG